MNTLFSTCLGEDTTTTQYPNILDIVRPQPIKFKIANSINLLNYIIKMFAQPRKIQTYQFQRNKLSFLTTETSHIPILYFPTKYPNLSIIMIYCHGSGSTLNNVYQFSEVMAHKYGIAFLSFDYTGDGQSKKSFSSYEQDLKVILAWTVKQGYRLGRTVLCGFSLGSYSALCLQGEMPRILISPICGIISFFEDEAARYENERYDNISKALKLNTKALITHCSKQMVHISHGKLLAQALQRNSPSQSIIFQQLTDPIYTHRTAPSYLCSLEGERVVRTFLKMVNETSKGISVDKATADLMQQLSAIDFKQQKDQLRNHEI